MPCHGMPSLAQEKGSFADGTSPCTVDPFRERLLGLALCRTKKISVQSGNVAKKCRVSRTLKRKRERG